MKLLYRTGGGGEHCGKVTVPHCSSTFPVRRGQSRRGIIKWDRVRGVQAEGGGVGGVDAEGAESEG